MSSSVLVLARRESTRLGASRPLVLGSSFTAVAYIREQCRIRKLPRPSTSKADNVQRRGCRGTLQVFQPQIFSTSPRFSSSLCSILCVFSRFFTLQLFKKIFTFYTSHNTAKMATERLQGVLNHLKPTGVAALYVCFHVFKLLNKTG